MTPPPPSVTLRARARPFRPEVVSTDRDRLLRVLTDYERDHGIGPSVRQMAAGIGRSKSYTHELVRGLVKAGLATKLPHHRQRGYVAAYPDRCPTCGLRRMR